MTPADAARVVAQALQASHGAVEILARPTADAIAGAAVLAHALAAKGRGFHIRFTGGSSDADLDEPATRVRVGAGPGPALATIDHHLTTDEASRTLGSDTPNEASTATLVLAVALELVEGAWRTASMALAGAWSEGQGIPNFQGWNAHVVDEATRRGTLRSKTGLRLPDIPLATFLTNPTPAVGLAPAAANRLRLPGHATLHELGPREAQRLGSALALAHLRSEHPPSDLGRLFGPLPFDAERDLSIPRLATLLSRAAQRGEAGLALGFLLGDAAARSELDALASEVTTA